MESSNADETDGTTLGMPSLSEALESTTPSSRSHTGNAPPSNHDQSNRSPKRMRPPKRVRSAPILVQASNDMSMSNSGDNGDLQDTDPGQDSDNPLPNRTNANAAQQVHTAEHYVPWLGDSPENIGLIPWFLVWLGPVNTALLMMLILALCALAGPPFPWLTYTKSWTITYDLLFSLVFTTLTALINWSPVLGGYIYMLDYSQSKRLKSRIVIVILACLFGFLSWAYCVLVSSQREGTDWYTRLGETLQAWSTGSMPQSFKGCDARIKPEQAPLFNTDIYYAQFARTWYIAGNNTHGHRLFYKLCDMERFRSIQVNQTLCGQGFEGNNDLYGLGIRISLYLQWLSSFLANNFLPETQQQLQNLYLTFSLAICLATIISSFVKNCVFSIEIEIMYWMYWGGYVCVFGSAPCRVRLGSEMKWIKLDWTTMILLTTHALMIYDGAWFVCYAYDQVFSRMPCGTYHFFFLPVLDPSQGFWTLRDYLTHMLLFFIPALLTFIPFFGLLLASEVKDTVQHSATYEFLFPKTNISGREQPQPIEQNASVKTSPGLGDYFFITRPYRKFREMMFLPSHSRGGIRLVTPIDIRVRRLYRLRWAAVGLLSYILSIAAIEIILKYNKVSGIYSLASTSQYVPLMMGIGGFSYVSWTMVQQEIERSRNLKRRQVAIQDDDSIELESLSHNLSDAISHAFSQPDIGFSTNGGAFPITSGEENEDAVGSLNNTTPNIEYLMSGALDSDPDLEAQTPPTN